MGRGRGGRRLKHERDYQIDYINQEIARLDAARYDRDVYGGHPLQRLRPDLQYSTQQLDNAAQYHHDNIAEEYLQRHEAAHTLAHGLESASEAAQKLNGQG